MKPYIVRLSEEVIDKLVQLHTEEIEPQKRSQLVTFWTELNFAADFNSHYQDRREYARQMIHNINGSKYMEEFLKKLLSPRRFRGNFKALDKVLGELNSYLVFDGVKVERESKEVKLVISESFDLEKYASGAARKGFIPSELNTISIENLGLDESLSQVLADRVIEIKKCLNVEAYLSVIFLAGSTLEGILLDQAQKNPIKFNKARSAPRGEGGDVKKYSNWTLNDFINVSCEVGLIGADVKNYSHSLRHFRNYIHPYEQAKEGCQPNQDTADISCYVLKAAIQQISSRMVRSGESIV